MYQPDTILKLREPRAPREGENGEEIEFPYNRVRVVGQSPINHAGISDEWVGAHGQGVIVEPLSAFGSNLDEPFGRLQELYEVESLPELQDRDLNPKVRLVGEGGESPGASPEEVFARDAHEAGKDARRVKPRKVKPSPLVDTPPDPEEVARMDALKREARRRAGITDPLDDPEDEDE